MQDTHTKARKAIILREGRYSSLDMQDTHQQTRKTFTNIQDTHSQTSKALIQTSKPFIQTSKPFIHRQVRNYPHTIQTLIQKKKRHLFTIKQPSYIFPCGYCSAWASAEKYSKTERVTQDTHLRSSKRPSQQQHQKSQPPDYSGTKGQHHNLQVFLCGEPGRADGGGVTTLDLLHECPLFMLGGVPTQN